jgi:CheY-like chemotaxis protein
LARILVVDDNNAILDIIRSVAQGMGNSVEVVNHASGFMTAFVKLKPDIVVIDVVMPDMDGIELIQWLADIGSHARIVITSGAQGGRYCEMAAKLAHASGAGRVTTLPKPFRTDELRSTLR